LFSLRRENLAFTTKRKQKTLFAKQKEVLLSINFFLNLKSFVLFQGTCINGIIVLVDAKNGSIIQCKVI
jgi:hypothetical protein